ncbi:MAG TPA: lysine exporter LysO family protein [Muribaculum sp.]|uniref:Lysine exporter LysO family protein n=1 Tax=Heminiphilus faecis TaxID=2601703 RepID=A0ABV4CZY7_9BACT|nr:lysine exporter LysO family protein [Heminiphilus faecis]RLT76033.1 lysine exporter LysO family protein [bacterium J10(2018)]HRF68708.1 lysine exporter LysO family protein [Muribaculum sp.]
MKGSIVIILFFLIGVVCGIAGWIKLPDTDYGISFYALAALMFFVGMNVGHDADSLKGIRSADPRLLLLPLMTIGGTLAGCALISLFIPRTATECLAIGSGFGYYSLSSIFISEYYGAELGTIALLSNIFREIITLLGAPVLATIFGRLAPISAGGATSMDTTLPIISQVSGRDMVIVSVFHGFVVDFSVPFLVTFFCTL